MSFDDSDWTRVERLAGEFRQDDEMEALHKQCRLNAEGFQQLEPTERIKLGRYIERKEAKRRVEIMAKREAARQARAA